MGDQNGRKQKIRSGAAADGGLPCVRRMQKAGRELLREMRKAAQGSCSAMGAKGLQSSWMKYSEGLPHSVQ